MKKVFLSLFVVAAVSFTACGGSKANDAEQKVEDAQEQVETVVEDKVEVAEKSALDQYEELLNQYLELAVKVKGGDMAAAQDLAKVAEKMSTLITENQEAFTNLTEDQAKKYQELAEKFAKAMQN